MFNQKKLLLSMSHLCTKFALTLLFLTLTSCASVKNNNANEAWYIETVNYRHTIESSHKDSAVSVMRINDTLRQQVINKFGVNNDRNAKKLAQWLISENGIGMKYDVNANLNPMQAFEQKRGNCLSFTLLFVALATELGMDIQFNVVDIPNVWDINEDNNYLLYRHINAVLKTPNQHQVFDLALDLYEPEYPQNIISREEAIAQLHSNKAMAKMQKDNFNEALHLIKLAISLSPNNEDLWINYGAILNQSGDYQYAEKSFLHAFLLNPKNEIVASRLERFYIEANQPKIAQKYQKLALKARESNPYFHYEIAKVFYQESNFKKAQSQIKKAIKLHREDSRFYELSSRISQHLQRYDLALRDVLIAYQLSHNVDDQNRYAKKAKLISKRTTNAQILRQLE